MQKYTNTQNIPLSLAVFLATDNYDAQENVISVTTLIKPLRQIVLGSRVPPQENSTDLSNMVASRLGSAIHDGIERSWLHNHEAAMLSMGIPKKVVERVRVNPSKEDLSDLIIPVYLEQRSSRKVGNYTISGKFDFVGDGRVEDFKTTSVYTFIHQTNNDKYILQGSIYRWLNPEIITKDEMAIQFIFTDWSSAASRSDKKYPQFRTVQQVFPLIPLNRINTFIESKLAQIDKYWAAEEKDIPYCSDEDLWRSDPVFKYYKNPDKQARSTKNFDNHHDAQLHQITQGVGIVVEKPGVVKACHYCPAFHLCTQKDTLIAAGDLVINQG